MPQTADTALPAVATTAGSAGLTLAEHLRAHPWPVEWTRAARPIDHLWRFDLDVSREALWPHLADTSTFNRRLGLAPMQFTERDDGGREGTVQSGGVRLVWQEVPWQWEYGRALGNTRIYQQGFLRYVRSHYLADELAPGRTRLHVYFGTVPRGLRGQIYVRLGMRSLRRGFARVLGEIVAEIARGAAAPTAADEVVPEPETLARLEGVRRALAAVTPPLPATLVERMVHLVATAPDEALHRIRVRPLARAWQTPERELVAAFLHATRAGLFDLTWDVICPHCRGARAEPAHLGDVPRRGRCGPCGIDFETTGLESLEVTFHAHPALRRTAPRLYCAAEPARMPHILVQRTAAPGERLVIDTLLSPGRYRVRLHGEHRYTLLDVDPDAGFAEVDLSSAAPVGSHSVGPHPRLVWHNPGEAPRTLVVERAAADGDALRPVDLFGLQEFRDLFSQEAVAADVQLDIGVQTILFADLVGSTRLYASAGDSVAFAAVRRYFVRSYAVVHEHEGVVIKTIGDAVMAAFATPAQALGAALGLQASFDGRPAGEAGIGLRVRVSLHAGPCLAVNLNRNIDYFGSTVNLAAKLQAAAGPGQVVFTDAVRDAKEVEPLLAARGLVPEALEFPMKWSGGTLTAHRLSL